MGFTNCFLSLDGYLNGFTAKVAEKFRGLMAKYELTATTVEVAALAASASIRVLPKNSAAKVQAGTVKNR